MTRYLSGLWSLCGGAQRRPTRCGERQRPESFATSVQRFPQLRQDPHASQQRHALSHCAGEINGEIGEEVFDLSETQAEAMVEPDRATDDLG